WPRNQRSPRARGSHRSRVAALRRELPPFFLLPLPLRRSIADLATLVAFPHPVLPSTALCPSGLNPANSSPPAPNQVRCSLTSTTGARRPVTGHSPMPRPNTQLRFRRERVPLTQAELAERVGVAEITVRRWEAGFRPQPVHIRSLSSVLNASPAELGFGPEEDQAPTE